MKNKTTKYFKYAVGEIVLVVIGILIAVQINSIYSSREKKKENNLLLKRMVKEVENNIKRLEYLDNYNLSYSKAYHLPSYRISEKNLDSCYRIILRGIKKTDIKYLVNNSLYNFSSLSTFRSVYDEMLNTGKIYTLKSDSLTTKIDNYYKLLDRQSNYVSIQLKEVQRSYENCSLGWIYFKQTYKSNNKKAIQLNPWLFDKNATEYKNFSNHIYKTKTTMIRTRERINSLINESKELIKALNTYLND